MTTFHVLRREVGNPYETEVYEVEPVHRGDAPRCPECGTYVGLMEWRPPFLVDLHAHGVDFGDVAFGSANEFLLSERALDAFAVGGVEELTVHGEAELRSVHSRLDDQIRPAYFVVSAPFSMIEVDPSRSSIARSSPTGCSLCAGGGVDSVDGVQFDSTSWDGLHIFRSYAMPGFAVVSDRVRGIAEAKNLRNMPLTLASAFVWP